jgi:hypothetical protein
MVRSRFFGGHRIESSNQLTRFSVADFGKSYRDRMCAEDPATLDGEYWRHTPGSSSREMAACIAPIKFPAGCGDRISAPIEASA